MSEFAEPGHPHDGQVLLVIRFQSGPDRLYPGAAAHRRLRYAIHDEARAAATVRRAPAWRSRKDHPGALAVAAAEPQAHWQAR